MKAGGVKSGRQSNLDIVRIIALCSVLLMHGVENVWRIHPADVASTPSLERVFIFITYTLGRLGVPLFLFLTGYLMLGKRYKKNKNATGNPAYASVLFSDVIDNALRAPAP